MFIEVNAELEKISKEIELVSDELTQVRIDYLLAKAVYENNYSKYLLETKLKNPDITGIELKATAYGMSYQDKLNAIKAESSYRKLAGELRALRDRLDAIREQSYNLREESRLVK